ncbi:MAG: hypothetical protein ISS01_00270 [Nanoarchaeota archaeon]|nr:hypothetical protein [Nanoarchaeota archaeon]
MEDLKEILSFFDISTTNIWISEGNNRKDDHITKTMKLLIRARDNTKFINKIKWIRGRNWG